MRHLRGGRKFSRKRNQRNALLKGLASSFFLYQRIQTTEAKAKELRPFVEKCITRGKSPTVANRRLLLKNFSPLVVSKILAEAEKHINRHGGYTRITKVGIRRSDSSPMAVIEMV